MTAWRAVLLRIATKPANNYFFISFLDRASPLTLRGYGWTVTGRLPLLTRLTSTLADRPPAALNITTASRLAATLRTYAAYRYTACNTISATGTTVRCLVPRSWRIYSPSFAYRRVPEPPCYTWDDTIRGCDSPAAPAWMPSLLLYRASPCNLHYDVDYSLTRTLLNCFARVCQHYGFIHWRLLPTDATDLAPTAQRRDNANCNVLSMFRDKPRPSYT